jgi:hypothetical protein
MRSLFASERAFSAFFALASADLVDFSALALAVVAASKAFLEASSSASSDEMRALAVTKASTIQTGKEKSNKTAKKGSEDKQNIGKKITLGSHSSFQILDTFSAQSENFFIKIYLENLRENEDHAGNESKHTSINTHIARGAHGLMGLEGSTGVCRLLRTSRTTSNDDLLNRSPWSFWGFNYWISLL